MIKEFQRYHGVVFSTLLHCSVRPFTIKPYSSPDNASYVVDERVAVYIKYSTKRLSPWLFTFEARHNDELATISGEFRDTVIALVCHHDGIAGLTFEEYADITEGSVSSTNWISVARSPRAMYTVKGPAGRLPHKVGMTDFCSLILAH